MGRNGTTVREVADRAGVSIATVSRVVRGVGQIAPQTRLRVLAAVEELGYRPSHLGRALVERRHAALGIILPGLSGPYYSEVIAGFETEAVAARQSVLILGTHLLKSSEELVHDLAARVDGLAVFGGTVADKTVRRLAAEGVPTTLLAGHRIDGVPAVHAENVESAIALTLHLLRDHGYDRLAFVGDPTGSPDVTDRWHGFLEAHRRAGIVPPPEPIRVGFAQQDGLRAVAALIDAGQAPRALVCANDETALGAYQAAAARGLRIPHDLAITGWDDIPMAGLVSPPLTTVRQPMRELGARTARDLLARIQGDTGGAPDILLPTQLVIRSSCSCPADRVSTFPNHSRHSGRRTAVSTDRHAL
jgi:LacI family transcriptional regulator